jgi:acyl carrier protein
MSQEELFDQLKRYMIEMFDVPAEAITLDADLSNDLDLDSIDAVDLIVKLQELIGRKIKADDFKTVRTVRDAVERIHELSHAKSS